MTDVAWRSGGPCDAAAAVAEFHRTFNLPMRQSPSADVDKSPDIASALEFPNR